MKRITIFIIIAGALMSSCKKADELKYSTEDNIYLDFDDFKTTDRDSVIFTFAYNPTELKDTTFIPVKLSGVRMPADRKFKMEVVADSTTAIAQKHYEPLKSEYIMPANAGYAYVPIIVYNTDTMLTKRSFIISFRLVETPDLAVDIVKMTQGRLVISNKLQKPYWWGPGNLTWNIPNYSQVKHELWLLVTGVIDLPFDGIQAPKFLYFNGLLTNFLNDPFKWISDHPDSGYMLTLKSEGLYEFYNVANPNKKTLYRKNAQTGKYYFIDENGNEVI